LNVEIPGIDKGNQLITGQKVQQLLYSNGWRFSNEQVQFRNTVLIDLTLSEAELLERMKQKTRYNIRLASRKGVVIRRGTPEDHHLLYRMYAETSVRDSFTIRDEAYYRGVWGSFAQQDESTFSRPIVQPLIAEVDGEPIAALILFMFADKAWYMYGMSRETHRDKMPNYLLQWEAICLSKSVGCQVYDLWGAPEVMEPSDPLWGVYRFKEGLGGKLTRFLGAWDFPVQPLFYKFYTQTMPRLLGIMRRSGQAKIRQTMG
jgi:peptidoglycan pentaglycine glycine transferase (the first glycine)